MPPPVPPMVKLGRMMAGRPMSSSAVSACGSVLMWCERGVSRPIVVIASRKSSRSSALSIASAVAPIISTSILVEHAHLLEAERAIQRRLAAHGRQQREAAGDGVALLGDDLGDDLRRDRLDIGPVGHVRIGHDRGRVRIDQDDPIAFLAQRLAGLRPRIIELARLPDDDRARADDEDGRNVGALRHDSSGLTPDSGPLGFAQLLAGRRFRTKTRPFATEIGRKARVVSWASVDGGARPHRGGLKRRSLAEILRGGRGGRVGRGSDPLFSYTEILTHSIFACTKIHEDRVG